MITQNLLQELFDYKDGELSWKKSRGNAKAGQVAGHLNKKIGYYRLTLFKKVYMVHRVIFMYHNGCMPEIIDHADNNKLNNRIENLRECTNQQNSFNARISKNNSSGIKGVSWDKSRQKWQAKCMINKKTIHLGRFETLEDADLAIRSWRDQNHGCYARHF